MIEPYHSNVKRLRHHPTKYWKYTPNTNLQFGQILTDDRLAWLQVVNTAEFGKVSPKLRLVVGPEIFALVEDRYFVMQHLVNRNGRININSSISEEKSIQ